MKNELHTHILLVGATIIICLLLRIALQRIRLPALIGYFAVGFGLRVVGSHYGFLGESTERIFEFLANLGVIALLFRIGLESDLGKLVRQLRRASWIWLGNMAVSGFGGFLAARYLLQIDLIPSLVVATAFTATSVGVSVAIWKEADALKSENGGLLLDVAEMDDVSGILLMALLFSLLPSLQSHDWASVPSGILQTGSIFLLNLVLLAGFCFLFSRYAEKPITGFFDRMTTSALLVVTGIGFIIAALAGVLGFSTAIGAFLAGLVFSRDPGAVKLDTSFGTLYDFLTPFFFIGIGLNMDPSTMSGGLVIGLVLAVAAILVKVLGAGLPAFFSLGASGAALIGISMVPRAEIAMVIMENGRNIGAWVVPSEVYSGMVIVSAVTCMIAPLVLHPLLSRWTQREEAG